MSGLSNPENQLARAVEDLLAVWHANADAWRDRTRDEFAADHLQPLVDCARAGVEAMAALSGLLRQVRNACA